MITMRTPFAENQISKLPKPTKQQTDALKADFKAGMRCPICKGWHHKDVVHLDYVGHAALTDRLLDVDPDWNWEPVSWTQDGQPALDSDGGMWIKLTVLGVTRLGYGDAQGKTGGDAMKERIGDALRNAGMRFGAALDLWHKGDLHVNDDAEKPVAEPKAKQADTVAEEALYTALCDKWLDSLVCIREALKSNDYSTAKEAWNELDADVKSALWKAPSKGGWFTTREREQMRCNEWSAA